jgi:alkylhydroperoxidase/carboxymuconolactone decarboxylase family protein YurZ
MTENPLSTLQGMDPEFIQHLHDSDEMIFGSGALSKKIKLLIAMAFDAAQGTETGVRALAAAAKHEGASKQEIAEALRVAYHLSGVGSLYTASAGLKDLF